MTDDASDCEWYGEEEDLESIEAGCCYAASLHSLAFSADLCQEYWNDNGCLVSYDANGEQNCRWEATADDVDCIDFLETVLEPHDEESVLFSGNMGDMTVNRLSEALHGEVSLFSVLLLFVALCALHRAYYCWKSTRNDEYQKLNRTFSLKETNVIAKNYQSMA